MKLSGRDAVRYFARPERDRAGLLIFGSDAMRVALRRQEVLAALVGDKAEEEMRLTHIAAGDLRKDPALLSDALKARGFFPGDRAVFLDAATDGLTDIIGAALADWQAGDAALVVTAANLTARSSLRKFFEGHPNAYAVGVYADPPSRDEIERIFAKVGLSNIGADAMTDLEALARILDPGDFRQTAEKLAVYKLNDPNPVSSADVAACAPMTTEALIDDALNLVAEARAGEVGPIMHKLEGQGVDATQICLMASRHFRALHLASCHPKGPEAGLMAFRPPVFGPRRDRMVRQARSLGTFKLEQAMEILTDTDLGLRSSRPVPKRAMLERALIRIAMLAHS